MSDPVADIERWTDSGAGYEVLVLTDERAILQLKTCHGEPVERLESEDPRLVAWLRERDGTGPGC